MPLFQYLALDENGRKIKGVIDADQSLEVKEKLFKNKIFVTKVVRISSEKLAVNLSKKELLNFTRELAKLLDAKLPLFDSLLVMEEKYRKQKAHSLILDLSDQIKSGRAFSEALESHPAIFDPLYCCLVANAEKTGNLAKALNDLNLLLSKQMNLKKQLFSTLLYPTILASFCFVVLMVLIFFIIPSFADLFENRPLNGFTKFVVFGSVWANKNKMFFFSFLFAGFSILLFSSILPSWKLWMQRHLFFKLPVVKALIEKLTFIRFSRACAGLLDGGVPLLQALKLSRNAIKGSDLEVVIKETEEKITQGGLLSEQFSRANMPPLVCRMIAIAEKGGNLSFMLHQIADIYEEELNKTLSQITTIAQPVLLLILGFVVGTIVLSVLLPLTDVSSFMDL